MTNDPRAATSLTLLARLRDNEAEAWSLMVQLYTPLVRRWGARAGLAGADLDDLAQEVPRAAVGGLPQFRRDRPGDSFRGWLHGITRNALLKHFERRGRSPRAAGGTDARLSLQEVAGPGEEPDDEEDHDERNALFRRALELARAQFEEKTWQAFWLTVIDDLSPNEAAARLGLTAVAVRKYKSRVLRRLRSEFGELID
ncbi:MAG TPA: sigma-70 family RNA polymerase sigma factor [Gemmataceae bacterium]|nr:sigma-70 family RNA polymerase sigma factor [Gemmataceae bacterium]